MALEIFISGNVPSKKNTQVSTKSRALVVGPSVVRWQKLSREDWIKHKQAFKAATKGMCPIFIHLTFIRDKDNTWDFIAPTETVADEMVAQGWINDDNIYEFVPHFGRPRLDRMKPGVIIKILKSPPLYTFV